MSSIKFRLEKKQTITLGALGLLTLILLNTVPLGFAIESLEIVVDDADATFVGPWYPSTSVSGYYGDGYTYNFGGSGSDTATWSFTIPEAGSWEVFVWWTSYKNRASDAPYTVYHDGGSSVVRVNQKVDGGEWVSLGVFDFDVGSASVVLSGDADGIVIADATKVVAVNITPELPTPPTPSSIVVDDADATFVGPWETSTLVSGYYGGGYRYHFIGSGSNTATWSFTIPTTGYWEVFAMWSSHPNRATNAPYTINHADGSTTVRVNQEIQGSEWVSLGVFNFNTGSASIILSDDANEFVIADATKLVPLDVSPEIPPIPSDVLLSYSSTPVVVDAIVDGVALPSGGSIQVAVGSSVTILASEVQNYDFSNWFVNGVGYTENPLTIDITSDLDVVAVYTFQQPPPSTSGMIVGVNMWSGMPVSQFQAGDVPLLTQAGIKSIRITGGVRDSFIDAALAEGIDVIGTFGTNGLPDLNAFGDYVYNRVLAFKGRMNAWVVFNEANYFSHNGDPQGYTQALKVAYTRAKQADPNVKIVTTNLLSVEDGLKFLEAMYQSGAKGYFDVLGIDPYCYPVGPTQPNQDRWGHTFWRIPELHSLMVQKGDGDKPVWIIEFGYRTPGNGFDVGDGKTVSEEDQATYLTQALELASTWPWLERFYIYEWMDSADVDLGYWGLIKEGDSPPYEVKPAYYAVKDFVSLDN